MKKILCVCFILIVCCDVISSSQNGIQKSHHFTSDEIVSSQIKDEPKKHDNIHESTLVAIQSSQATVDDALNLANIFLIMAPPIASSSIPYIKSKTDSSAVIGWAFDQTNVLTKAVDVTNVTVRLQLTKLVQGGLTADMQSGLSTINPNHLKYHPILAQYRQSGVNLSLPLYDTIPEKKTQVFLRKPVKTFQVELQPQSPGMTLQSLNPDGWEIVASVDVSQTEAEIESLRPGTNYFLRISSANGQGKGVFSKILAFQTADVPSQPPAITLTTATATSLQLDIPKSENSNGSPIIDVVLETSTRFQGPFQKVPYDWSTRSVTIENLEPGGLYFFRSTNWNQIGPSRYSRTVSFETLCLVPEQVPEVKISSQSANVKQGTTEVIVAWGVPDARGKPISNYEIQKACGDNPEDESAFATLALIENTNFTLSKLEAGKMYFTRIRAINSVGPGNWSTPLQIIAAPSVTTSPGTVTLVEATPRSLELQWDRPSDFRGAAPDNYLLQMQTYPKSNNTNSTKKAPDPKTLFWNDVYKGPDAHVVLKEDVVSPARTYNFRVKAINLVGSSEPSEVSSYSTQITTPDAPQKIRALRITTDTILLSWDKGEENGSPITSYTLKIAQTSDYQNYLSKLNDSLVNSNKNSSDIQTLLSSDSMFGTLVSLSAEKTDDLDDINNQYIAGRSRKDRAPCKAISPSVYDIPVSKKYQYQDVIPGTQMVYPERPGQDRESLISKINQNNNTVTSTSTNISLSEPTPNSQPRKISQDGFSVLYEGPLTQALATVLDSGESYSFVVQATNKLGTSPPSQPFAFTTTPTIPRRPNAPLISSRGHNFISFTWPAAKPRGSPVTSYIVQIADKKGKEVFQNTCLDTWNPALGGIEILRNYTNKVLNTNNVDVDGSPIEKCKKKVEEEDKTQNVKLFSCCVDGLAKDTTYLFRIIAVSAVGVSEPGPSSEMSTKADLPQVPLTPRAIRVTPTTVSIDWPVPPKSESIVYLLEKSTVEYGNGDIIFNSTGHSLTVSNLRPDTRYYFRLKAQNQIGISSFSEYLKVKTCDRNEVTCEGIINPGTEKLDDENDEQEENLLMSQLAMDAKLRKVESRLHSNLRKNSRIQRQNQADVKTQHRHG